MSPVHLSNPHIYKLKSLDLTHRRSPICHGMHSLLKFILVVLTIIPVLVRTTKINFNIKEAKDPMDHSSNPTVVVKSNVIIIWVIIH